jgi:hypothetical protein
MEGMPEAGARPRLNVLASMWDEFAHEHHMAIKEMIPQVSPWHAINYCSSMYADYILNQSPEMIAMATKHQEKMQKALNTPIGARVWLNRHKGICPTCGLDMNRLLGKGDFNGVPHMNGTCKQQEG